MKLKGIVIAIFNLFFLSHSLKATHLAGGEITYEHVINDSFRVKVKLYRDCNSNVPFNLQGLLMNGCGSRIFTLTATRVTDITGISASCGIKSRCTGTYPFGIEEHIFEGGFKLLNDTCCNYTLGVMQCCRSSTITTGPDNSNLYLEASFNKCLAPKNYSPQFINTPTFLAEVGDFKNITSTALDTIDGDSLSYELVNPYSGNSSQVGYSGQFSISKPLTFSGFPNNSLPSPQGFHFDKQTGDFEFEPVLKNQVTVITVKVKEWRKINGVTKQIGEAMREFQLTVIRDTINTPPTFIKSERKLNICGDTGKYCFQIPIVDKDSLDYVHLSYHSNVKNITFTESRNKISKPVVEVCITVDSNMLKKMDLQQFTINATDSACNLPGKAEKTYYFSFAKKQIPNSFSIQSNISNCREITSNLINNSPINSINTSWKLRNTNDTVTKIGDTTFTVQAVDTGWHYIMAKISSSLYCEGRTVMDSVYIGSERFFKISLGPDQTHCFKSSDTLQLYDTLVYGKAPYRYKWSTGNSDTNTTTTHLDTGENKFWVEVMDNNQCTSTDTIIVGNYSPKVTLNYPPKVCYRDPFKISVGIKGAKSPQFEWVGFTKNQLSINTILYANGSYNFLLTDTFGCKIDTTINITIWNPTTEIINISQCNNDTVVLTSLNIDAKPPVTYNWTTFFVNNTQVTTSTSKDSLFITPPFPSDSVMVFLYAADSNGCSLADTIIVHTKNPPQSVIPNFTASKTIGVVGDTIKFINLTPNSASIINRWNFGDFGKQGNIVFTQNPSYKYNDTGKYSVKLWVKNANCPEDSIIKTSYITITNIVSVKELFNTKIKVYPNPAKNKLTIEANNPLAKIVLIDVLGKRYIIENFSTSTKTEIKIAHLAAGIYIIEAKDIKGTTYTSKVQISR